MNKEDKIKCQYCNKELQKRSIKKHHSNFCKKTPLNILMTKINEGDKDFDNWIETVVKDLF